MGMGLVLLPFRPSRFRLPNPVKLRPSPEIRYTAVCSAVAAADLRAAWARASANFCDQSGRMRSVVMTAGEDAEIDPVRRRPNEAPRDPWPGPDAREDEEDIADVGWASPWIDR